jgi:hypothetical protein
MAKGGDFEREVAGLLSKWWTQGERDDVIWRTDASGARATVRKKGGKKTAFQHGDLTFTDPCAAPLFQIFSIECKTGYARKSAKGDLFHWCILDVVDSAQKETIFEKMWNQAVDDAAVSRRIPLLIFRRNRRQICIAMERTQFLAFKVAFGTVGFPYVSLQTYKYDVVFFVLKDFLEWSKNIQMYVQLFTKESQSYDSRPVHRELPVSQDKLAFIRARRQCNYGNK